MQCSLELKQLKVKVILSYDVFFLGKNKFLIVVRLPAQDYTTWCYFPYIDTNQNKIDNAFEKTHTFFTPIQQYLNLLRSHRESKKSHMIFI